MIKAELHAIADDRKKAHGNAGKTPSIENAAQLKEANAAFQKDFPDFRLPKLPIPPADELESMLYTRLLFSCLVDADYTASAMNDDSTYLDRAEDCYFDPQALLETLYAYCGSIRQASTADKTLNQYRDQVFEQCGKMGDKPEGLYTLTAPTGTGKTLALLHFALRHCLKHGKKRIIIVLPFLTLAEQNADTYAKIIPNVLVDHSQSDLPEEARELAARLGEKYSIPVLPVNCIDITEQDIRDIIASLLYQFPVQEVALDLPGWVTSLESGHWLLSGVLASLRGACCIHKMCQVKSMLERLRECEPVKEVRVGRIDLGSGTGRAELVFDQSLFYRILGAVSYTHLTLPTKLEV